MQIFVKTLSGISIIIKVNPDDTIYQIKKVIEIREQIPISLQRLIFSGHELRDENSLIGYKIEDSNTIHLLTRVRGD